MANGTSVMDTSIPLFIFFLKNPALESIFQTTTHICIISGEEESCVDLTDVAGSHGKRESQLHAPGFFPCSIGPRPLAPPPTVPLLSLFISPLHANTMFVACTVTLFTCEINAVKKEKKKKKKTFRLSLLLNKKHLLTNTSLL